MHRAFARVVGQMPPFGQVAHALWGDDADVDSDGDSETPESTNWRELTLILRPEYALRIDIVPTKDNRDIIELRSDSADLLNRTLAFLEKRGSIEAFAV